MGPNRAEIDGRLLRSRRSILEWRVEVAGGSPDRHKIAAAARAELEMVAQLRAVATRDMYAKIDDLIAQLEGFANSLH
jgi:hypothetical protein